MKSACLAVAVLCLAACDAAPSATPDAAPTPDMEVEMSIRTHRAEEGVETVTLASGQRLAYFEFGTGPLVLLLHGFPDTPHTWRGIAPALAEAGYRVVTPFSRGYAPSAPAADDAYDAISLGTDVIELIEALGEDAAVVVGHDWGATAAYAAANLAPERITRLVTLAIPHPRAFLRHPDALAGSPHFAALAQADAAVAFAADDFAGVDTLYARWSPTWARPEGELEAVKNCFAAEGSLDAALGYYRAFATVAPDPRVFAQTSVPTLTFAGSEDGAGDPAPFADHGTGFTQPPEVVVLPVGHFVHREAEAEVLARLRAFIQVE